MTIYLIVKAVLSGITIASEPARCSPNSGALTGVLDAIKPTVDPRFGLRL